MKHEKLERWAERLIEAIVGLAALTLSIAGLCLFVILADRWPEGIAIVSAAGIIAFAIAIRKPDNNYNLTVSQTDEVLQRMLEIVARAEQRERAKSK